MGDLTIYVLVWNERHQDIVVEAFTSLAPAVLYAEKIISENLQAGHQPDRSVNEAQRNDGIVYFCTHSDESDYVFIRRVKADPEDVSYG